MALQQFYGFHSQILPLIVRLLNHNTECVHTCSRHFLLWFHTTVSTNWGLYWSALSPNILCVVLNCSLCKYPVCNLLLTCCLNNRRMFIKECMRQRADNFISFADQISGATAKLFISDYSCCFEGLIWDWTPILGPI